MQKKHWYLLMLALLVWTGYRLFYKRAPANTVPATADCIAVLDVKRLTSHLLWEVITTPSLWKPGSVIPGRDKYEALTEQVNWPDYIIAFHMPGGSASEWYTALPLKDSGLFADALQQAGFRKDQQLFRYAPTGINLFISGNRLLAGTAGSDSNLHLIAHTLFREQALLPGSQFEQLLPAGDQLALHIRKEGASFQTITVSLTGDGLHGSALLEKADTLHLRSYPYHYFDSSALTIAFAQPDKGWRTVLPPDLRQQFIRLTGCEPDTLLAAGNLYYELDLKTFQPRTDSILTYTFNEQFEPVETLATRETWEPVFNVAIQSPDATVPFRQLLHNQLLKPDTGGYIFTPAPVVKTYGRLLHAQQLSLHSWQYPAGKLEHTRQAVLYVRINPDKIPLPIQAYLPDALRYWLPRIARAELEIDYNESGILQADWHVYRKRRNGSSLDW